MIYKENIILFEFKMPPKFILLYQLKTISDLHKGAFFMLQWGRLLNTFFHALC